MRPAPTLARRRASAAALIAAFALASAGSPAQAQAEPDPADSLIAWTPAKPEAPVMTRGGLEALVPELAEHPFRIEPGVRPYRQRLVFSPGYGRLGSKPLFVARVTYHPSAWLGYEWSFGHNPGQSVHAVLHQLSAIVRRPLPGRFQPYVSAGYGMMMVFPGQSLNAAPVTKNTISYGGGLEVHIRGDLAVRADLRHATVLGRERDRNGTVAYDYFQQTLGLAFYRSIRP